MNVKSMLTCKDLSDLFSKINHLKLCWILNNHFKTVVNDSFVIAHERNKS